MSTTHFGFVCFTTVGCGEFCYFDSIGSSASSISTTKLSCIGEAPGKCWSDFYIRMKIKTKWFHVSETHAHHSFCLIVCFHANVYVNQTKIVFGGNEVVWHE